MSKIGVVLKSLKSNITFDDNKNDGGANAIFVPLCRERPQIYRAARLVHKCRIFRCWKEAVTQRAGMQVCKTHAAEAASKNSPSRETPTQQGILTSVGSIAHADGNCKPCVFTFNAQRPCTKGAHCQFCHLAHPPKRRFRLCKQKRLALHRAFEGELITLAPQSSERGEGCSSVPL